MGENVKKNSFLVTLYVLTFVFIFIGATFSYFSNVNGSENGAVAAKSAFVGAELIIKALYNEKGLIPLNDTDVYTAIDNECVDINEMGACQAYTLTLKNIGEAMTYAGTIVFDLDNITNLNYMVLDEEGNEYQPLTNIVDGDRMSLGTNVSLLKDETKSFTLVVWVPNYDYDQIEEDNGMFSATVSYESPDDYRITGSVNGG